MNYLKILGSSGNKSKNFGTTSFQISNDTTIDAGNIINSSDDETYKINHIFVTHAHLDHIGCLPIISKEYPNAKIYMNNMTKDLVKVLLYDSLKI